MVALPLAMAAAIRPAPTLSKNGRFALGVLDDAGVDVDDVLMRPRCDRLLWRGLEAQTLGDVVGGSQREHGQRHIRAGKGPGRDCHGAVAAGRHDRVHFRM